MSRLIPRMHLFEIDDQPWFPAYLRSRVQSALTIAWTIRVPLLQSSSPAQKAASLLITHLDPISQYGFIDFCAGAGGPTPEIEQTVNSRGGPSSTYSPSPASTISKSSSSYAATAASSPSPPSTNDAPAHDFTPIPFILTDLHPHIQDWTHAASLSPNLYFLPAPVDASAAPSSLLTHPALESRKPFRLYNLAFHHFPDHLARRILKNTLETSSGFAIFELQDRTLASFVTVCLFGLGILLLAPYYAWRWRDPGMLVFTYLIPILPFVLVFDGWVSGLRVRTRGEVESLLRECGAEGVDVETEWEVRSGTERILWPCGEMNWVICLKRERS